MNEGRQDVLIRDEFDFLKLGGVKTFDLGIVDLCSYIPINYLSTSNICVQKTKVKMLIISFNLLKTIR